MWSFGELHVLLLEKYINISTKVELSLVVCEWWLRGMHVMQSVGELLQLHVTDASSLFTQTMPYQKKHSPHNKVCTQLQSGPYRLENPDIYSSGRCIYIDIYCFFSSSSFRCVNMCA